MKHRIVVAVMALLLAVPMASAATYDQPGNGPERTGQIPFEGPQTNDTAFEVHLPGVPFSQPALIGDDLYLYTGEVGFFDYEGDTDDLTENALWRIDLASGSVQRVMDLPFDQGMVPAGAAISPDRVLLQDTGTGELVASQVPSGEELWRFKVLPDDPREERYYAEAVRAGGLLYVGFNAESVVVEEAGFRQQHTVESERVFGIVALDPSNGEEAWTWTRTQAQVPETGLVGTETVSDRFVESVAISADEERVYPYLLLSDGLGYGEHVGEEYAGVEYASRVYELHALDASDGTHLWNKSDTEQQRAEVFSSQGDIGPDTLTGGQCCAWPVVTPTRVTMRLDAFVAWNPVTGEELWTSEAGRSDHINLQGALGMGIRGDTLIGASPQTIYRLDAGEEGDIQWQETSPDRFYANEPIVLDEETAYIPMHPLGDDDNFYDIGIEARALDTGKVRWTWDHHPDVGLDSPNSQQDSANPVFGPGVMAWPAKDGTVSVIGQTNASLGAPPIEEEMYPPEDDPISIEVPEPEPGAFGPATRYMVDWGDGTVSGWQADPVFTHTYDEEGEHTARVIAGNDANQTSSSFVTMNVGQQAPTEPNWISERFEPDNQDMTFGVLGILVAVTGGAVGVTQRYRRRSRLQDELEALEDGFEQTKSNPGECEAFLDTRKARARSLLMDGDLTEEQFGVVERRVDDLHRELRTTVLDARFQFLPHGMVQAVKKMLADGRLSAWERDALDDLLDREETLSQAQREKVRAQLDRWFSEDRGGGAS